MRCFHPVKAWVPLEGGALFFWAKAGTDEIQIRCGQCIGCRIERSRQMGIRIMHEAQLHERNSFLTLTYKNNPVTLNKEDITKFIKRLRKKHEIRYYYCGEYGEKKGRPHYHMCLFGENFEEDRYKWTMKGGNQLYKSPALNKTWGHGEVVIGDLTQDSAQYTAAYIIDKITGDGKKEYFDMIDNETGEITPRLKEFAHMSLKPGIGMNWLRLYWQDIAQGKVVVKGKEVSLPKMYKQYLKGTKYEVNIKDEDQKFLEHPEAQKESQPDRLAVKEEIVISKIKARMRNSERVFDED